MFPTRKAVVRNSWLSQTVCVLGQHPLPSPTQEPNPSAKKKKVILPSGTGQDFSLSEKTLLGPEEEW